MKEEIYLDNAATTKIDSGVLKLMNEFSEKCFANASSQHRLGREVREKIEEARKRIADYICADTEEIIFTSGGTESDNFALRGLARANPDKKHIITSAIEHPAILEVCRAMEREGYEVDYMKVDSEGIVDVNEIEKKIRPDTLVVSIMHVNNEIGTVQPIEEIGKVCKKKKVYFHSDAVQSFTKIPIDVSKMNIDLISVSGHKVHAPKGIGFLYAKVGTRIKPLIDGGGQEFRLRGGTENSIGIVALAKAIESNNDWKKVKEMRDYLMSELLKIKGTRINGSREKRCVSNVNVSFYGIEGEGLLLLLEEENIFVSTGSACASHSLEESHVLQAIGVDDLYIHGSIRITLDREITKEKIDYVVEKIRFAVEKLRMMSPFKLEEKSEESSAELKEMQGRE